MQREEDIQSGEINKETQSDIPTERRRRKRDYVPTEEEMYYHKLAYDPLPAVNVRSRETVQAMHSSAPWIFAADEPDGANIKRDIIPDPKSKIDTVEYGGKGM